MGLRLGTLNTEVIESLFLAQNSVLQQFPKRSSVFANVRILPQIRRGM